MTDIVERLRNRAFAATIIRDKPDLYNDAADEIERLREALKPFAYYAELIPDDISDTCSASGTVGDLRAARKALGETA